MQGGTRTGDVEIGAALPRLAEGPEQIVVTIDQRRGAQHLPDAIAVDHAGTYITAPRSKCRRWPILVPPSRHATVYSPGPWFG